MYTPSSSPLKATFGSRLMGFFIDAVILRLLWFVGFIIFHPESNSGGYGISSLITIAYFVFFEGYFSCTIGMMIVGLRIINANNGETIGFALAVSRTIGRFACMITIGIGYLSMLSNKDKQALHDRMSQTFVVIK